MDFENRAEEIKARVEAKRQEAERLGIWPLIHFFFSDGACINAWPAWLENNPSEYGNLLRQIARVSSAVKHKEGDLDCVTIVRNGTTHTFKEGRWRPSYDLDDPVSLGEVHFATNECKLVYEVEKRSDGNGITTYRPKSLERLIGTDWVGSLRDLRADVEKMLVEGKRRSEVHRKKEELKKLVENFGLDGDSSEKKE